MLTWRYWTKHESEKILPFLLVQILSLPKCTQNYDEDDFGEDDNDDDDDNDVDNDDEYDDDDIANGYCQCWRTAACRPTLALTIRPRFGDDDDDDDDHHHHHGLPAYIPTS